MHRPRRPTEADRRTRAWRLLVAALVATVVAVLLPGPPLRVVLPPVNRTAAQPGLPWLSTDGADVIDETGRIVLLRGFNSEALLDYPTWTPSTLDESDAVAMERSGFDVLRLPIAWSRLEPTRGTFDTGYLDLVDRTVAMLNRHHLYVVLDMHFLDWGPRYGGSGAPRWAAVAGEPDWGFGLPDPFNKHASPGTWSAMSYFFLSGDWQRDYRATWQFVAQRFRDRSGVVGYDLYNEPHSMPLPPVLYENDMLWPLYAQTIADIGHVDPNHLFIPEGLLLVDWGTTIRPLAARNVLYSTHTYSGSLIPPLFTGDSTYLQAHLHAQAAEATHVPAPYWDGELGIDWTQAHATGWADAALDSLDDVHAGWAWWQWRQDSHWGIREANGTMHMDTLAHVARPYLQAAPPRVVAGRGDGVRGTLQLTVGEGVADAEATVGWPGLTLRPPVLEGSCAQLVGYNATQGTATLRFTSAGCVVRLAQTAA